MAVHLAKGTRDFLPAQMRNRMTVMRTIQRVFERFGFEPLSTPALERLDTLAGKYGDEGERLMFKILARGEKGAEGKADLGLRYDLTVPMARVIAMNQDLRLPFKRWQMAPVWRAENPQRGRFREFWQCDCDIAGSTSPLADAECVAVAHAALTELGFHRFVVRLNDRRILRSMARLAGASSEPGGVREAAVLVAIDKLDKIGRDGVTAELEKAGLSADGVARLWAVLDVPRGHVETLDALAPLLDDEGRAGVATLRDVLALVLAHGVPNERVAVDPTLARGLDYYTGPVFETEVLEPKIGSISGGGRYDGLVGMFSGKPIPCVGVSLGMERIITVMEELGMLPATSAGAEVMVTVFHDDTRADAVRIATALRAAGIDAEIFLGAGKLGNQLKHADARHCRFAVVAGPDEIKATTATLKDLRTGSQRTLPVAELAAAIRAAEAVPSET
jgi:histidyl-tRNA synthetase